MYLKNTRQDSELSHCCYYQIKLSDFLSQHGNNHNWARPTTPAKHTAGKRFSPAPTFWWVTADGSRGCKIYKTSKIKFHFPALLMPLSVKQAGAKHYRGEEKPNLRPALDELRLSFRGHISFCSAAGTGVILVSRGISFST